MLRLVNVFFLIECVLSCSHGIAMLLALNYIIITKHMIGDNVNPLTHSHPSSNTINNQQKTQLQEVNRPTDGSIQTIIHSRYSNTRQDDELCLAFLHWS